MANKLRRIQDLFREGDITILEPRHPETGEVLDRIPVFVKKLSALEKDEAVKDARAARARKMLAFDRDEDEQVTLTSMLGSFSDDDLREDLLRRKAGEFLLKAEDEVRADKSWRERLDAIDRSALGEDGKVPAEEQALLEELVNEFQQAITKAQSRLMRVHLGELKKEGREELEASYRTAWREMLGSTAFYEARRQTEVWYALRDCQVQLDEDGDPILTTLEVGERICATRAEVNDLPDDVITQVLRVLDGEMTSREAGNSDAPSASSGSSEQRSAAEASRPSSPRGM